MPTFSTVRPRRRLLRRVLTASVLIALAFGIVELDARLRLAVGYAAKCAASAHFVGGRSLDAITVRELRVVPWVSVAVAGDRLRASCLWVVREARARDGLGATLLAGDDRLGGPDALPWVGGAARNEAVHGLDEPQPLDAVLDAAMTPAPVSGLAPRAVLVRRDGRLVAERYADGIDRGDLLPGWSMAKTVTAALVGVLVGQGRLAVAAPAPVAEWRAPEDPRAAITLGHLLQMSSGLSFEDVYTDPNADAARMLFGMTDMAGFAAAQSLDALPGARFAYSSGTTNLIARIACEAAGGTVEFLEMARRELFEPAAMGRVVFELDPAGRPVGSSYVHATARGWSRFGQLLLDDGVADRRRCLPEGWVRYMTTPASSATRGEFGAHVWLNRGGSEGPARWPHCPADTFAAAGHNGQLVAVVPSRSAVVVRLAWDREGTRFDVDAFLSKVLDALP